MRRLHRYTTFNTNLFVFRIIPLFGKTFNKSEIIHIQFCNEHANSKRMTSVKRWYYCPQYRNTRAIFRTAPGTSRGESASRYVPSRLTQLALIAWEDQRCAEQRVRWKSAIFPPRDHFYRASGQNGGTRASRRFPIGGLRGLSPTSRLSVAKINVVGEGDAEGNRVLARYGDQPVCCAPLWCSLPPASSLPWFTWTSVILAARSRRGGWSEPTPEIDLFSRCTTRQALRPRRRAPARYADHYVVGQSVTTRARK